MIIAISPRGVQVCSSTCVQLSKVVVIAFFMGAYAVPRNGDNPTVVASFINSTDIEGLKTPSCVPFLRLNVSRVKQGAEVFTRYALDLAEYLQTLEQRLFSEGLHTLGHAPAAAETEQYLAAYFGDDLPQDVSFRPQDVMFGMGVGRY